MRKSTTEHAKTSKVIMPDNMQRVMSNALVNNAKPINGVKYIEIPMQLLTVIKDSYQRDVKKSVKKIAAEWDKGRAGAIVVSYRDGVFYIIDGQHRYLAAKAVGEEVMGCQVYEGLTIEKEAEIFGLQLQNVTKLSTVEQLKSLKVAKNRQALDFVAICDKYNIVVFPKHKDERPVLRGLRVAMYGHEVYGDAYLHFAFGVIKKSGWHNVTGAYSEAMLLSLRNIYANHKHELAKVNKDLVHLLEKLNYKLLTDKACGTYIGRGKHAALTTFLEKYLEYNTDGKLLG